MSKKQTKDERNKKNLSCKLCGIGNIGRDAMRCHKWSKRHKAAEAQLKIVALRKEMEEKDAWDGLSAEAVIAIMREAGEAEAQGGKKTSTQYRL